MKISTRSRYGTRILAELASYQNRCIPLGKVAAKHNISRAYVQHSMAPLVRSGIIATQRGIGGGISLNKPASEIKLSEVVPLLEGHNFVAACINNPETCARSSSCRMRVVWKRVAQAILSVLDSITLQDMVDQSKEEYSNASQLCPDQEQTCL